MKLKIKVSALNGPKDFELESDPKGKSLLDLFEQGGARMPFGCRAGSCGVCRVRVTKGRDGLSPLGVVEEDTLMRCQDSPEIRLACQAEVHSTGDIELEVSIAPEVQIKE